MWSPNSIFYVHTDMLCKKRAHKCQYSEDELLTKHKDVAIQRGHTNNHAKAAEKSRKWRGGGGCVCAVHVCVSGYAVCS